MGWVLRGWVLVDGPGGTRGGPGEGPGASREGAGAVPEGVRMFLSVSEGPPGPQKHSKTLKNPQGRPRDPPGTLPGPSPGPPRGPPGPSTKTHPLKTHPIRSRLVLGEGSVPTREDVDFPLHAAMVRGRKGTPTPVDGRICQWRLADLSTGVPKNGGSFFRAGPGRSRNSPGKRNPRFSRPPLTDPGMSIDRSCRQRGSLKSGVPCLPLRHASVSGFGRNEVGEPRRWAQTQAE